MTGNNGQNLRGRRGGGGGSNKDSSSCEPLISYFNFPLDGKLQDFGNFFFVFFDF